MSQPDTYGPDTVADIYGAKVVLNDVGDMYTKARLDQTPLEASTWTKEESAPYPPLLRLTHAAMLAVGEWTGVGFYGLTLALAAFFIGGSAWYFLQTRWYLFPLLYLNFSYLAERFVYVQDGSYLVMLVCVLAALLLARHGRFIAPLLAVATAMKLLPLAYARHLPRLPKRTAWVYAVSSSPPSPALLNRKTTGKLHSNEKANWMDVLVRSCCRAVRAGLWSWRTAAGSCEDRIGSILVPFAMLARFWPTRGRQLYRAVVPDPVPAATSCGRRPGAARLLQRRSPRREDLRMNADCALCLRLSCSRSVDRGCEESQRHERCVAFVGRGREKSRETFTEDGANGGRTSFKRRGRRRLFDCPSEATQTARVREPKYSPTCQSG